MYNQKERWSSVALKVVPHAVPAAELAFNLLDAAGIETGAFGSRGQETVTVTGYFEKAPDEASARNAFERAAAGLEVAAETLIDVRISIVENEDWLAGWKKYWQATASGRFLIAPPWEDVSTSDKIVVTIEPNMAFGTGTHDTTRLCLIAIGEKFQPGYSMLDVGTGTGILSIAAAKLGGNGKINGYDNDPDSIRIARENAAANGVADRIEFFASPINDYSPAADLVCANLTLDVIQPILPQLIERSIRVLILSGILVEQEAAIVQDLRAAGITDWEIRTSGEWIAVVVDRG